MNTLNLLLKESKDRTSKEIERLLANGDVESAKKAAYIINKMEGRTHKFFDRSPWFVIQDHSDGKISDNEFIDKVKKMYYGDSKHELLNKRRIRRHFIKQNNHNGKTRWAHPHSVPLFTPKGLLEVNKLKAFRDKTRKRIWSVSKLSDEDKKIYDKMRLGKDFGIKKSMGGFGRDISDEAIERAKKLLEKSTVDKNVLKIPKVEQPKTEQPKPESRALVKVTGNAEQPPKPESRALVKVTGNAEQPKPESRALVKVTGNAEQPKPESRALVKVTGNAEQPPKDINNKGNTNGNNANINNNSNNGNNGNTPKPEPEVKTNPVKESFLKKHWGKIGMGVGALGALGYGAYKYKHRDDNNSYS